MLRILAPLLALTLSACQCGSTPGDDGGTDASTSPDSGKPDAGTPDAGPKPDSGIPDAGPVCVPEVCDGVDNDCNGTIDLSSDGGALTQLCPLQLGTCQGAKVQCVAGKFPACAAEYGAKYEEFESLCDGVDNDCSGFVDVSQWRAIGELQSGPSIAVSVPGGWYVATGSNAQMFDEQLRPTSIVFPVGRPGAANLALTAVSFGGYMNQLFSQLPVVRRLNLDGTYALGPDGGGLEIDLPAPLSAGGLRASNDRSTLLVTFSQQNSQDALTLWPDGGTRASLTQLGDAGAWLHASAAVGAEGFVAALSYPGRLELQAWSPDLVPLGSPVNLAVPANALFCAVTTHTTATDAGLDAVLAVCPEPRRLYAAENVFTGGTLAPLWEADAGAIANVRALPSYARATIFWEHVPSFPSTGLTTVWMSQVNALPPTPIAELAYLPSKIEVVPSIRGGYLLEAVFDGGQGVRPYGAYVCPP